MYKKKSMINMSVLILKFTKIFMNNYKTNKNGANNSFQKLLKMSCKVEKTKFRKMFCLNKLKTAQNQKTISQL